MTGVAGLILWRETPGMIVRMGTLENTTTDRSLSSRVGPPRWKLTLVPVVALLALFAWGMSSPVSSSPDDNYHLSSIWCGLGDRAGLCESTPGSAIKLVPEATYKATCFAYDPGQSGGCLSALYGEAGSTLVPAEHSNTSGGYPPVFYAAMSVFASSDVWASTAIMRLVNSVLFVGLVGLLWFALPRRRRGTLLWSIAISVVPLGLFIIPSTNPSSWALLSASTLWLALLGWTETQGRRKFLLGALAVIATVIGAGARSDSAIFAIISVVVVGIFVLNRESFRFRALIFPILLIAIAAVFFLSSAQSLVASSGLEGAPGQPTESALTLTLSNILLVPALWMGVFGSWGLGWLDTVPPAIVSVAAFGAFAAVVFLGLGQGIVSKAFAWKKGIALALAFSALWAMPVYILVRTNAHVGAYVQPRYILPLIIMVAAIALIRENGSGPVLTKMQALTIVGALSVANTVALFWNIRRYVTGTDVQTWNLNARIEWWWSAFPSPMIVWVVGSLSFVAFLWLISPSLRTLGGRR